MFRFSLATFLLTVAVVSLLVAGLAVPNLVWERIVGCTIPAVLIGATITAIAWQKTSRWFWVGFAVTGWIYLAIAFYGGDDARDILLTDVALLRLDDLLETSEPRLTPDGQRVYFVGDDEVVVRRRRGGGGGGMMSGMGGDMMGVGIRMSVDEAREKGYWQYAYSDATFPRSAYFHDIGHFAWAFVLACIGGSFSLWLYRRSSEDTS